MALHGPPRSLLWIVILGFVSTACSRVIAHKTLARLEETGFRQGLPSVHLGSSRGLLSTKSISKLNEEFDEFSSKERKNDLKKGKKAFEKAQDRLGQYEARRDARQNLRHRGESVKEDYIKARPKAETGMKHVGWK
eukprot:CAMPEP_0118952972 /NCGR_PEP_ID=MMETSP1169-20130426/55742_1 /TAXON_ID=36882 /ORGANISM="Pyramimonas obovata, Strain CCMP722" /LENGTH=135 /DNA_ID=CAMNT_0006900323 /DNA_START=326 /DNA_END=733 /DNA_ORIENTATION=+